MTQGKRRFRPMALLAATMFLGALPVAAQQGEGFDHRVEARKVIDALGASRFAEVEGRFSAQMAAALPPGQLAQAWAQVTAQVGTLKSLGEPQVQEQNGATVIIFPAEYERGKLNLIVAWDPERKLVGLLAQPAG